MQLSALLDTARILAARAIRLDLHGIRRLARVNTLFDPGKIVWNFSNLDKLFNTLPFPRAEPSPLPEAFGRIPQHFTISDQPRSLGDHIRDRNLKSLIVLKDGAIRHEAYFQGTRPSDPNISWSMNKSVLSILLGALIDKGLIAPEALEHSVSDHVPGLQGSGYDGVTLRQVLNMTSGVAFNEDYMDYHSDINRLGRVIGVGGSIDGFAATLGRRWQPGTYSHYVSVDTHVIGMTIRALTGARMMDLLSEHIIHPIGFEHPGFMLCDDHDEPFVLGGLNLSARDYARIGQMMLQEGAWNGNQVVSAGWVARSTAQSAPPPDPETAATPNGALGYGMQWWLPPSAVAGEFFAIGIYGQYIYINRPARVVIVQTAADTGFRAGDGQVNIETLELFRQLARGIT
ncbi:6-aminohexanoate-dimer hydrolase [Candidatus Rhodobacter oscarellae]|uniref:6-aminohexanoate-dimer hydrolase n=1 Tax=Candidatus Rhodobacter oscarellae TaxID=1675527 RepID=A0A0J9E550_9RHOB|nr:serine hydrolase [Candidatus Rhodobacter lobularis]KMW57866.1 6-aminohexanoate-dimer hydrolase [Candidatus Rhodobacter lobularis]